MKKFWLKDDEMSFMFDMIIQSGSNPSNVMEILGILLLTTFKDNKITWIARPASFDWVFLKCYYVPCDSKKNGY